MTRTTRPAAEQNDPNHAMIQQPMPTTDVAQPNQAEMKQQPAPTTGAQNDPNQAMKQQHTPMDVQQNDPNQAMKQQPVPTTVAQPKQQATQPIKQEKHDSDTDAWRKDRRGQWLSPHALYMRFYRSARSN